MRPFSVVSFVLALALVAPLAAQEATPEPEAPFLGQVSVSDVYWAPDTFWGEMAIPGASSNLARFEEGVSMSMTTTGLEPGETITIWWIVFNHPEQCTHGEGPMRCGEGDLLIAGGNEAVEGTVLYATGHVIGPAGVGHFDAFLATGDTTYALLGAGPGLTNPLGAEIHFVVRTHGPVQPGLVDEQVTTFGGGCSNIPEGMEGTGEPGDFECVDLQFAVHVQ